MSARVRFARDRGAAAEWARWSEVAASTHPWQRRRRASAERNAAAARRRALASGVDWSRLPAPPPDLKPPDRSGRERIGRPPRAVDAEPAGTGGWVQAARAVRQLFGQRPADEPLPGTAAAALAPGGGGVGALHGAADPAELTAVAARDWLASQPAPAHVTPDGAAWFEGADGTMWVRTVGGEHLALAPDGERFLPLSADGYLYTQGSDGAWRSCLADGAPLSLRDDGQLVRYGPGGAQYLVADDGLLYLATPAGVLYPVDAWGEPIPDAPMLADDAADSLI